MLKTQHINKPKIISWAAQKLYIIFFVLTIFTQYIQGKEYLDSLNKALKKADENQKAQIYNELASHFLYEKDYLKAREYVNMALDLAEKYQDNNQKLKSLNHFGNIEIAEGNYEKGGTYTKEAYNLAKDLKDLDAEALAANLLGNVNYFLGNYDDALSYWRNSLDIRESQKKNEEAATLYMNIGIIYKTRGEYNKAIEYNEKARKIHKEIGNLEMVGRILGNIGNIYFYSELDYQKSLDYYTESLEYFKNENNWYGEANIYNSIGLVYDKLDSIDMALSFFNRSYEIFNGQEYKSGMAQTLNSIGTVYLRQNKPNEALDYFYQSLEIFQELGMKRDIALTQNDIGSVFFKRKDYRRAQRYKLTALKIMNEMGAKKEASDMYKELAEIYEHLNDYQNAYKYHNLYSTLKDSLISTEYTKQISEMQTKYETEKKDRAILKQEAELKRQKIVIYAFVVGISMFIIFSILLIKQINQKKKAHDKITKQNKEITDSIQYASRIQNAVLPSSDQLSKVVQDHFILFRPKDIVSGDFYWMTVEGDNVVVAAADCTGHGVPGAFMSMLGISFLNEIVKVKKILKANEILNELRKMVKTTLAQSGENVANDGMDISLVVIDHASTKLQYAGAYNHLYIFKNNELLKIKADRMPIGNFVKEKESFTNNEMDFTKGETFYIFSDGYCDQFGGENNEKYTVKRLQEKLLEINAQPMHIQRKTLYNNFAQWKGDKKQIDDVLLIGVKI